MKICPVVAEVFRDEANRPLLQFCQSASNV